MGLRCVFFLVTVMLGCGVGKLTDGKTIIYTLPRPGVTSDSDCYIDLYRDDMVRDIKILKTLGATTVMTWNGLDFGSGHKTFLSELAKNDLSLGITFKPDLDGSMRRNLEKLSKALEDSGVSLEYIFVDYPLNFDNADAFFQWIIQVRAWTNQEGMRVPLLIRFFPGVSDEKTILDLAEKWDTGAFDAWVIEVYSKYEMVKWIFTRFAGRTKRPFFIYGTDSYNSTNSTASYRTQADMLNLMLSFTLDRNLTSLTQNSNSSEYAVSWDKNSTAFIGIALQGYSDNWYLANYPSYYLGNINDVCPDENPYLQTSCGGSDPNIEFGDMYYSVEHFGVFKAYETLYYIRCIVPTDASRVVGKIWGSVDPKSPTFNVDTCTVSLSLPYFWSLYVWGAGILFSIIVLVVACCKCCCRSCQRAFQRSSRRAKLSKMKNVLIEQTNENINPQPSAQD